MPVNVSQPLNGVGPVDEAIKVIRPKLRALASDKAVTKENIEYLSVVVIPIWARKAGVKGIETMSETQSKFGTDMSTEDIVSFEKLADKTYSPVIGALLKVLKPYEVNDIAESLAM